jgi:predicted  nucleic acid-binding Zn-ribbon protein
MAGAAAIIAEIHRLRSQARALQERIDLAPKQYKAQQGVIAKREDELKQGQETIKKLKVAIHEHEVSIKAAQQQIAKYEQQLNDIHSKKEYDALKHEIAGVQDKIRAIEDQILTAMMDLDAKTTLVPPLEEAVKKAKAEFANFERDYQERLDLWSKERDASAQGISAEEAKLPPDIRPQYDRLIKAMGPDAMAHVEGKNCAACYTEMTAQWYNNVLKRQFVVCRNCGRILYLKD